MLDFIFFYCSLIFLIGKSLYFMLFFYIFLSCPLLFILNFDSNFLSKNSFLCLDSVSLLMIILSIFIIALCFISLEIYLWAKNFSFLFSLCVLFIFLLMYFLSTNFFMFFFFFESCLIPTLFLILGWGKNIERIQSGFYLFYYTLFSSLPMLISIFYFLYIGNSLIYEFMSFSSLNLLYFFFIVSFLVKMPMFFVHSWLPKAHVEAPVFGSMILAGILLKMGGYGLYRFLFYLKFFPNLNILWIYISLWGSVLSSMICLKQSDMKCLVAFSSVSHMSFVIMGFMTMNKMSILGSCYMMFAHGFCSSGLFFLVNTVYLRSGTRNLILNKGLISSFPSLTMWWFFFCVMNMGCPPSLNLFGEIFVIISILNWSKMFLFFIMSYCFLSAVYNLLLFTYLNHGSLNMNFMFMNPLDIREYFILALHFIFIMFSFLKVDFV